jgi:hypothetical protein
MPAEKAGMRGVGFVNREEAFMIERRFAAGAECLGVCGGGRG